MGYGFVINRLTKVIPTKLSITCRAKCITEVLPSCAWIGRRCFIIGGGPSLSGFNYSILDNELTIGINKAFVGYHAVVNYSMDPRFYDMVTYQSPTDPKVKMLHQEWLRYHGIKVFMRHNDKLKFDSTVYYVNDLGKVAVSFDLDAGIYKGNNSGCGALMLAIGLGCDKIGLLGYDMKIDKEHDKTHWHDGYDFGCNSSFHEKLDNFIDCFNEIADAISDHNIKVFNLNPDSKLTCFPKNDIDSFLKL